MFFDKERGMKLLERSAEQGFAKAQLAVGTDYPLS